MPKCKHDPATSGWKAHWWASDKTSIGAVLRWQPRHPRAEMSSWMFDDDRPVLSPWHENYNEELVAWLLLSNCTIRRTPRYLKHASEFSVARLNQYWAQPPLVSVRDESCPVCWREAINRAIQRRE